MVIRKKIFFLAGFAVVPVLLVLFLLYMYYYNGFAGSDPGITAKPSPVTTVNGWSALSGNRKGKVVFARPPKLFILDLTTGLEKEVPRVTVAGAPNRRRRGKSPRPSWSPEGDQFVYRYDNNIYVCDERGNKRIIANEKMDCSDETRWSWYRKNDTDWLAGPAKNRNVILVKVSDPSVVKTAYGGGDVEKH